MANKNVSVRKMIDNFKQKFVQIKDQFSTKQLIAFVLLLALLLIGLFATVYLVKQQQRLQAKADADSVKLQLHSTLSTMSPGDTVSVDFGINAGTDHPPVITGADVRLTYSDNLDLTLFDLENVGSEGKALNKLVFQSRINNSDKRIRLVAVNNTQDPVSTNYIALGTLQFRLKPNATGSAQVKFEDSGNQVVAVNHYNALTIENEGEKVDILVAGSASPSASPTTAPRIPGDATGDRCVNYADYNCWRNGVSSADFNNDGRVNLIDYTIWLDAVNSGRYTCAPGQARTQCLN